MADNSDRQRIWPRDALSERLQAPVAALAERGRPPTRNHDPCFSANRPIPRPPSPRSPPRLSPLRSERAIKRRNLPPRSIATSAIAAVAPQIPGNGASAPHFARANDARMFEIGESFIKNQGRFRPCGQTRYLDICMSLSGSRFLRRRPEGVRKLAMNEDTGSGRMSGMRFDRILRPPRAGRQTADVFHNRTLLPRHRRLPPDMPGGRCHPCARNEVSPMSRAAHFGG